MKGTDGFEGSVDFQLGKLTGEVGALKEGQTRLEQKVERMFHPQCNSVVVYPRQQQQLAARKCNECKIVASPIRAKKSLELVEMNANAGPRPYDQCGRIAVETISFMHNCICEP